MELQKLYYNMDVSHLAIDEIEHELYVRKISFKSNELESTKRRRLKEVMKNERETNSFKACNSWRTLPEEITLIKSKLLVITGLLENPKTPALQRIKLKTKLIHYRVRIFLATKAFSAHKYASQLETLGKQASKIYVTHFPDETGSEEVPESQDKLDEDVAKALEEVRNEIEIMNESVVGVELDSEKGLESVGSEKTADFQKEIQEVEVRKKSLIEMLEQFETTENLEGNKVIENLKSFVQETSEQQKAMREQQIEEENRKLKEIEENMNRKIRLEQLLVKLNDHLKIAESKPTKQIDFPKKTDPGENSKNRQYDSEFDFDLDCFSQSSSDDSSSKSSSDISTAAKRKYLKRAKKKRSGRGKSRSKVKGRKHQKQKVSFSGTSDSVQSTDSESSSSSSSFSTSSTSSSSSDSSSDSRSARRKNKKHKKSKKKHHHLKRIPVSEWRLKYDGKDQGRKLSEFLKEVKMRQKGEKITDKQLFQSALHLFSGRAKDWFMEGFENKDFRKWSELKKELKREFLPPDLDFQTEVQASNRRQARGEKFGDYFRDMQKLFQSMTKPMSDSRKFEIIWRNMRYDYKNALTAARIKSLSKLKKYGRILDENNCNLFQKPVDASSRPKQQYVNEIITSGNPKQKQGSNNSYNNSKVFSKTKPKAGGKEEEDKFERSNQEKGGKFKPRDKEEADAMEGTAAGTMQALVDRYKRPPLGTCYNCGRHGHHYSDCSNKRGNFCRICGFPDVHTTKCLFCQKNGQNSA